MTVIMVILVAVDIYLGGCYLFDVFNGNSTSIRGIGFIIGCFALAICGFCRLIFMDEKNHGTFAEKRAEKKRQQEEQYKQYVLERERKRKEEEEREKIRKAQEQAALELKKRQEAMELEKNIAYFENSEVTKKIVNFIREKSNGVPYTIEIRNTSYLYIQKGYSSIKFYFEGGSDEYNFSVHQLNPLKRPDDEKVFPLNTPEREISEYFFRKWQKKNNAYYLACAINRHFNNIFSIEEQHVGKYDQNDDTLYHITKKTETTKTCSAGDFSAKLTREKQNF